MRAHAAVIAGTGLLALALFRGTAPAQAAQHATPGTNNAPSVMTIDVTGRPIPEALDVIEQRYGVAIDYSDPVYASNVDTQLLYSVHGKPLTVPTLIARIRTLKFQYIEVNGKAETCPPPPQGRRIPCYIPNQRRQPKGGITLLIQQLLKHYAAQGGQVFGVRKLEGLTGPQWDVYPKEARNALGTFVPQTDFLGATINIPTAERTASEMLGQIAQQLTQKWGRKFLSGEEPIYATTRGKVSRGAEGVTARQALVNVLGAFGPPPFVWRMFTGPGTTEYVINIASLPYREPPRPPTPRPVPARVQSARPALPLFWMAATRVPKLAFDVQGALAKAGYLQTAPTTKWDANAVAAVRRFQAANGLPPTGKLNVPTLAKLEPFLPEGPARVMPAKPAMDYALAYWLGSTPEGRKEIAGALTKAGFYNGPISGSENNPRADAALKAFQAANGLKPDGWLTYQTAEKLAPFLANPK
ncbi:MAG TPA: peptidoglycan-binding domain-containing protein [Candidatus Dormibacteraeota bacterium]|nr:peptidoglycan-binding domain-containing protein [Candidatus Dormibacteraeota bacterium]